MEYQSVFKRYELKYILTREQKQRVLAGIEPYMELDQYGCTVIRNIYFDTDNYRLIRHSIQKPVYKEKLRLRSYQKTAPENPVFVELKKKYAGVVYKRRLSMPEQAAMDWICGGTYDGQDSQISREIGYFRDFYQTLHPKVFLSYEREAYYCRGGGDFRITFDDNILTRQQELTLGAGIWGDPVLNTEMVLMEIKTSGAIPLWMTHILTREGIYKTSFSKYGTAYQTYILPNYTGGFIHA